MSERPSKTPITIPISRRISGTDIFDVLTINGREWYCRQYRAARFDLIYRSLLDAMSLDGDLAEIGCWIGLTSSQVCGYLDEIKSDKLLHCFDSFQGLDLWDESVDHNRGNWLAENDPESQFWHRMKGLKRFELHKGHLSLASVKPIQFDRPLCWAYVDVDLYHSTHHAIDIVERCIVPGGIVAFDDYGSGDWPGVQKAVDERLSDSEWEIVKFTESEFWICLAKRRARELGEN